MNQPETSTCQFYRFYFWIYCFEFGDWSSVEGGRKPETVRTLFTFSISYLTRWKERERELERMQAERNDKIIKGTVSHNVTHIGGLGDCMKFSFKYVAPQSITVWGSYEQTFSQTAYRFVDFAGKVRFLNAPWIVRCSRVCCTQA